MKDIRSCCDLKTCMLCRLSISDWIPAVNAHRRNLRFNKGELLFREGDQVTGIYFVYSGTVKVHKAWGPEKDLIIRFAKKGDIVGHRGLGKDNIFSVSATALETSIVCFMDISFFLSTLRVNESFLFELMMFYAGELKESERNMRNLAHMPVKGRIAQALITLQEKFGTDEENNIDIVLSKQDLASFAGTTYETFFRVMNELSFESIIAAEGKRISILDLGKLRKLTTANPAD